MCGEMEIRASCVHILLRGLGAPRGLLAEVIVGLVALKVCLIGDSLPALLDENFNYEVKFFFF